MTMPWSDAAGHADADLLAGYAVGTADPVAVWLVEDHLTACARCRSALSAHADAERLARNRSALLVRVALPGDGRVRRLLTRCGVPDHLLGLLAATPSLRRSWLLSVIGVVAVVAGEAAAVRYGWIRAGRTGVLAGRPVYPAGYPDPEVLAPFLLIGPLLVLAGVAAAFLPSVDPACRLAVAAPFSGFTLLLVRTVCALAAALVPVVAAAFVMPGPGWLPAALLLPVLAVCVFALALATVMQPRAAAITADDIAAICPRVVVLLQGQVHFTGTPAELAATAAGRVWAADERGGSAHLSWRGGDNRWRHIGDQPPAGADLVAPTVEDSYLLLCHAADVR